MAKTPKNAVADADEEKEEIAVEFALTKPINAYGEEVKVLKLRKPMGADLLRVGNPVKFSPYTDPPQVDHDYGKVLAMVARLANVPSSSLERLDTDDLSALAWTITPFFIPSR
ncbi:phage tail assembly protein [Bradyrhizobium sp. S3.7.6]